MRIRMCAHSFTHENNVRCHDLHPCSNAKSKGIPFTSIIIKGWEVRGMVGQDFTIIFMFCNTKLIEFFFSLHNIA